MQKVDGSLSFKLSTASGENWPFPKWISRRFSPRASWTVPSNSSVTSSLISTGLKTWVLVPYAMSLSWARGKQEELILLKTTVN